MIFSLTCQAIPSAIDDEELLIFLADMIEDDGVLIDPLSMNTIQHSSFSPPDEKNESSKTLQNGFIKEQEHE